jgi:uncharacterized membrane protein
MRTTGALAVAAAALSAAFSLPAAATTARPLAHHFQNCTDMHRVYQGGVARRGAHDHRASGGHAQHAPQVSTRLYNANAGMDRDHDGVACEQ